MKKLIVLLVLTIITHNKANSQWQSFHLNQIKILDGPFYEAQQADLKYILELDPDRLLAPFLKEAGIKPLKPNYGNWESMGLDGHTAGHYLSALSLMYAATGNPDLLSRIQYMLGWIDSCQQSNGNGYVGGVPDGKSLWNDMANGNIDAGSFSLGNRWVPLYNLHKTFAGLRDVYLYTNNQKALAILIKLTDWFYELTKNLTDEQVQTILNTEHGGLNEVFVDVAHITNNTKYINLAIRFSHRKILDAFINNKDILPGLHANTQIPKVIGFKCIADATQNKSWNRAAQFFWQTVVDKYTVSIGGHGVREHFNPANDFSSMVESNQGPETCNTYNMLKLTKYLYLSDPQVKYLNFYERALFNHILSSINRKTGGLVYFTPMKPCHYRVYSQPQQCFWCCVGTGMENHARYGEMIYAYNTDTLAVNLFIASQLNWSNKGIVLTQQTKFPYQTKTQLKLKIEKNIKLILKIRKPEWINTDYLLVKLNNKASKPYFMKNGYVVIDSKWENGDSIIIDLPMHISTEYLPDKSPWISILYGPIVLASACDSSNLIGLFADDSRMGHVAHGPSFPLEEVPFLLANDPHNFQPRIKSIDTNSLTFQMEVQQLPDIVKTIELRPFFDIHELRYCIYFPVYSDTKLQELKSEIETKTKLIQELESRTIDQVSPGEQQSEVGHNFKGEETEWGVNDNRFWRHSRKWFSYDLSDPKKEGRIIQVTYFGLDAGRTFDIRVNNQLIATETLSGNKGPNFYTVDYPIPNSMYQEHNGIIKIQFVAKPGSLAGGIYYIRLLK